MSEAFCETMEWVSAGSVETIFVDITSSTLFFYTLDHFIFNAHFVCRQTLLEWHLFEYVKFLGFSSEIYTIRVSRNRIHSEKR